MTEYELAKRIDMYLDWLQEMVEFEGDCNCRSRKSGFRMRARLPY